MLEGSRNSRNPRRCWITWQYRGIEQLKYVGTLPNVENTDLFQLNSVSQDNSLRERMTDTVSIRYSFLVHPVMSLRLGSQSRNTTANRPFLWTGWEFPIIFTIMDTQSWPIFRTLNKLKFLLHPLYSAHKRPFHCFIVCLLQRVMSSLYPIPLTKLAVGENLYTYCDTCFWVIRFNTVLLQGDLHLLKHNATVPEKIFFWRTQRKAQVFFTEAYNCQVLKVKIMRL